MNPNVCVICELESKVEITPVAESLYNDDLLRKEIYHHIQKSNVDKALKWRSLLHSINFQENRQARLALIQHIKPKYATIAKELEKADYNDQIGCICGPLHRPFQTASKNVELEYKTINIDQSTEGVTATPTKQNLIYKRPQNPVYLDIKSNKQLLVFIVIIVCVVAAGLYIFPALFVTGIIVLAVLHLYFNKTR